MHLLHVVCFSVVASSPVLATEADIAASAINSLGLELHRQLAVSDGNTCLSPYSIQTALAMTFAGASGATRSEMARVLHYPDDEAALHASFGTLQRQLGAIQGESAERSRQYAEHGGAIEPIVLHTANRLFAQQGFEFRAPFAALVQDRYHAPLEILDFVHDTAGATARINGWVAEQTRDRIRDIVSPGALGPDTRLALINAVYFRAPWATPFYRVTTKRQPFHVRGGAPTDVTTMWHQSRFGYRRFDTFRAVAIPYSGGSLQFLVLVPDAPDGLAGLEASLTCETLRACATLPVREVELYLPKFKLKPPTVPLSAALQQLGMKSAFDRPLGSADFDRMTPRRPAAYLYLSEVFHKTFLSLDEEGTEAAAATAAVVGLTAMRVQPQAPVEVRVDRPFLYAIQHVTSGTCLFIGHVVDPR